MIIKYIEIIKPCPTLTYKTVGVEDKVDDKVNKWFAYDEYTILYQTTYTKCYIVMGD